MENLIEGKKYMIDNESPNRGVIQPVHLHGKYFCQVKDPDTGNEWDTMCNRLSPIQVECLLCNFVGNLADLKLKPEGKELLCLCPKCESINLKFN